MNKPAFIEQKRASLDTVLAYKNEHVVADFCAKYAVSEDDARELFQEVKKWVWACAVADACGVTLTIDSRLLILDDMWHTFVLFTRDYHEFCSAIAGRYIHHRPTTQDEAEQERAAAADDFAAFRREVLTHRRRQYELLFDLLGEDTVRRWYVEYPRRYSTVRRTRIAVYAGRRSARAARGASIR